MNPLRAKRAAVGPAQRAFALLGAVAALVLLANTWAQTEAEDTPPASEAASPEPSPEQAKPAPRAAYMLTISGAIGPATSDYVLRGLDTAQEQGAGLVILVMDTPGGLDSAMREIIKGILGSSVPVATYVYPSGSRAASAGTYILYASHIAAMAPATNLGAATPVQIGAPSAPSPQPERPSDDDEKGEDDGASEPSAPQPQTALERKAVNDAVAYIRSLADMRGRNAEWAEEAVRSAASLAAADALAENVIDILANDVGDLLQQIDGREVSLATGSRTVRTQGLLIERVEPDWRTRLLDTLTNPNVAYLLMLIGIYGLIFEGYNPGAIVPGVVGAICLLLALYAFQVLSVNYAGLALIALGIVLMISEIFVPSFGALGIGGIVAFVIGSIILIDTEAPGFGVDRGLIGAMGLVGGSLVMAIVWLAVRARRRPVVSGVESFLGNLAVAASDFDARGTGTVRIQGEVWEARTRVPVRVGQKLKVVAVDGLLLEVEPPADTEGK